MIKWSSGNRSSFLMQETGFKPVKLTLVAIASPPMQPCTVCLGVSCGDGLRQLAAPKPALRRVN